MIDSLCIPCLDRVDGAESLASSASNTISSHNEPTWKFV